MQFQVHLAHSLNSFLTFAADVHHLGLVEQSCFLEELRTIL